MLPRRADDLIGQVVSPAQSPELAPLGRASRIEEATQPWDDE